jgi:general secretion pathway protein D
MALGLDPCFTPVESNGMAEAFVKTSKRDYISVNPIPDAPSARAAIEEWMLDYNEVHPHSRLGYRSPREYLRANLQAAAWGSTPARRPREDETSKDTAARGTRPAESTVFTGARANGHSHGRGAHIWFRAATDPKRLNLRSINHDRLPNLYAQIDPPCRVVGASILLLPGSLATRSAACLAAFITVSGCAGPGAVRPTFAIASKEAVERSQSLDAYAYDQPTRSSAIALPSPASQAIAVTDQGDGRMIGETPDNPRSSVSPDATVVLNLASVPLQQAAKTVLGDLVGVNYVVDPRVDGVISVQTTRPVTKSVALELFQSALAPIGAALVENRGIYRIVPADQSATGAISTGNGQRNVAAGSDNDITGAITAGHASRSSAIGGDGIRIVQLKYVAATEVARVLEPMVPKGSVVQADDARNILALKGSPGEIASMLDTVSIFDVDVMRGMSFAVVPVKTAQPEKLADELKAVFSSDKEGPLKGRVRFMANTRLNAILVVTSQPSYLPRAQSWIKRLDAKVDGAESQLHIYQVQNRPVGELATILQSMFSDQIKIVRPTSRDVSSRSRDANVSDNSGNPPGVGAPGPGPGGQGGIGQNNALGGRGGNGDLRSLARMLNNDGESRSIDPMESASPSGTGAEQPSLKIVADETKNSLLIMANDRNYQRILRVIQGLDVVPSQVLIEAVIAEVDLNDDLQYGVQWQLRKGGTPTATFSNAVNGGLSAAFPGFNYAFNAANVAATLSALNAITHVNVISTPSLMVLDNKTARLQVGDQVPITTQTATSTVTANTAIVNSITMQDTGVILSVTPRINESGRVQLEIEQEVSSVVATTTSNIDSPTIQQRKVKTTVVVNDGEVLALGGMIQETASKTSSQIPILGSLPGIGAAFANKDNAVKKTELVVLITPRVVRDGSESRSVTEEYRRKFKQVYMPHESTREQTPAHTLLRLTGQ